MIDDFSNLFDIFNILGFGYKMVYSYGGWNDPVLHEIFILQKKAKRDRKKHQALLVALSGLYLTSKSISCVTMYLQPPTEEQKEDALNAINATEKTMKRDVQHLVEWFRKQPHLPNMDDHEDILESIILGCKNSLEKAKSRMEAYFFIKSTMPEIFMNRDPFNEEIVRAGKLGMYVPLPKLTPDGYRVIMLYLSEECLHLTPETTPSVHTFIKITQMSIDLSGKLDFQKGTILVHDGKNMNFRFVTMFSSEIQKIILLNQKTLPIRYHKIYCLNTTRPQELFVSLFKAVIKKRLADRIELLKDGADLIKVLPKEIVPQDYGGDELPLAQLRDRWYEELKRHADLFALSETYVADVSKMPKKQDIENDLLGISGSFRQISID